MPRTTTASTHVVTQPPPVDAATLAAYHVPDALERTIHDVRNCTFDELIEVLEPMVYEDMDQSQLNRCIRVVKAYVEINPEHWASLVKGTQWPLPLCQSAVRSTGRTHRRPSPHVEAFRREFGEQMRVIALDVGIMVHVLTFAPRHWCRHDVLLAAPFAKAGIVDPESIFFEPAFVMPQLELYGGADRSPGGGVEPLHHIPDEWLTQDRLLRFFRTYAIPAASSRARLGLTLLALRRVYMHGSARPIVCIEKELELATTILCDDFKHCAHNVVSVLTGFIKLAMESAKELSGIVTSGRLIKLLSAGNTELGACWALEDDDGGGWSRLFSVAIGPHHFGRFLDKCGLLDPLGDGGVLVLLAHRYPHILDLVKAAIDEDVTWGDAEDKYARFQWFPRVVRAALGTMTTEEYAQTPGSALHAAVCPLDTFPPAVDPFADWTKLSTTRVKTIAAFPRELTASETFTLLRRMLPDVPTSSGSDDLRCVLNAFHENGYLCSGAFSRVLTDLVQVGDRCVGEEGMKAFLGGVRALLCDRPIALLLLPLGYDSMPPVSESDWKTHFLLPEDLFTFQRDVQEAIDADELGYGILPFAYTPEAHVKIFAFLTAMGGSIDFHFYGVPLAVFLLYSGDHPDVLPDNEASCKQLFLEWCERASTRASAHVFWCSAPPWRKPCPAATSGVLSRSSLSPWTMVPTWLRQRIVEDTAFTDLMARRCPSALLLAPSAIQLSNVAAMAAALASPDRIGAVDCAGLDKKLLDDVPFRRQAIGLNTTARWAVSVLLERASSDAERVALVCDVVRNTQLLQPTIMAIEAILPAIVRSAPQYVLAAVPVLGSELVLRRAGGASPMDGVRAALFDVAFFAHGGWKNGLTPFSSPAIHRVFKGYRRRGTWRLLEKAALQFLEVLEWELRTLCTPDALKSAFPLPKARPSRALSGGRMLLHGHASVFAATEQSQAIKLLHPSDGPPMAALFDPSTTPDERATIFAYLNGVSEALGEIGRIRPHYSNYSYLNAPTLRPGSFPPQLRVCYPGVRVYSYAPSTPDARRELYATTGAGGTLQRVALPPELDAEMQRIDDRCQIAGVLTTGTPTTAAAIRLTKSARPLSEWENAKIYNYQTGLGDAAATHRLFFDAEALPSSDAATVAAAMRRIEGKHAFVGYAKVVWGDAVVRFKRHDVSPKLQALASSINEFLVQVPLHAEALLDLHQTDADADDDGDAGGDAFSMADAAAAILKSYANVAHEKKARSKKRKAVPAAAAASSSKAARPSKAPACAYYFEEESDDEDDVDEDVSIVDAESEESEESEDEGEEEEGEEEKE